MTQHYTVLGSAAFSGVARYATLADAQLAAEAEALRDGVPRVVVQVHGIASRKTVSTFAPAIEPDPEPDPEIIPPNVAAGIDAMHRSAARCE